MSAVCKDLPLNPCVHWCFTCLGWVFFLCSFQPLVCPPQTTWRFFCFLLFCTVILHWRSSMTEFVGWRLCLIVFKKFSDRRGIRTHAHTRVPEFSTEVFLEPGSLSCLVYVDIFLYDLYFFNWVEYVFHRFNLLNVLCHPFVKIYV